MNSTLDPAVTKAAQEFLDELSPKARHKADRLYRDGKVESLTCVTPGRVYTARVFGSEPKPYTVTLTFGPDEDPTIPAEWDGECTCPVTYECKHIGAVLRCWLHKFGGESAGAGGAAKTDAAKATVGAVKAKPSAVPATAAGLKARLTSALGRALNAFEADYVKQIEQVFDECRRRRTFQTWDANALGFRPKAQSWDSLSIWPSVPGNAVEFWMYVAYAAIHDWGAEIPEFMECITDFTALNDSARRWRRQQSIEQWNLILESQPLETASQRTMTELRLRLLDNRAVLDVRTQGQADYKILKLSPARQLQSNLQRNEVQLTVLSSVLWGLWLPRLQYYGAFELAYGGNEEKALLQRIVSNPALRELVYTADSEPYAFAQAIDRTHRIGQTQKVIAYRLLIKDSVEEKIRALQKQKRCLVEDVLGEEKFSQSLTIDDLRFLLAD